MVLRFGYLLSCTLKAREQVPKKLFPNEDINNDDNNNNSNKNYVTLFLLMILLNNDVGGEEN
jgi:hypothetical protein